MLRAGPASRFDVKATPAVARITASLPAFAAVLLVLAVPAFWPDYLGKLLAVDALTHVHALFGLLWLLLLVSQPLLIRAQQPARHRGLGRLGIAVGAGFVVSSLLLTHHRASRMDDELFARVGSGFYLPLVMAVLFAAALALALIWRRAMPLHGRYMACTALALIDPLTARLLHFYGPPLPAPLLYQVPAFTIIVAVLFALLRTLPPATPGRGVFAAFAAASTALLLLYFVTPYSAGWMRLLDAFRALPLT